MASGPLPSPPPPPPNPRHQTAGTPPPTGGQLPRCLHPPSDPTTATFGMPSSGDHHLPAIKPSTLSPSSSPPNPQRPPPLLKPKPREAKELLPSAEYRSAGRGLSKKVKNLQIYRAEAAKSIDGGGLIESGEKRKFLGMEVSTLKKVIPLGLMFFCILFNYTILRDTKDVLVVTVEGSSAEIIPFLKTWVNLPLAVGFMLLYTEPSSSMEPPSPTTSVISLKIFHHLHASTPHLHA